MLKILQDKLPQSLLSYLAFRLSFQETLERIALARQMHEDTTSGFGFLTEVPFLKAVPPHVQLDLLAATWSKHISDRNFEANLVDESVIYACCETSARLVEAQDELIPSYLKGGPLEANVTPDRSFAPELRGLHLNLSNNGEFLMISQFEDMHPDEAAETKKKFGICEDRLEIMFETLGRWQMSPDFLQNLTELFTGREILKIVTVLGVK